MRYFKILSAAAGIIALTSNIGFARNMREAERNDSFRGKIEVYDSAKNQGCVKTRLSPIAIDSETGQLYFAESARGDKSGGLA